MPWWLDAVCGANHWGVCLEGMDAGSIQGVLPYFFQKKLGFRFIRMPILTPYLGISLNYPENIQRSPTRYSFEKKTIGKLLDQLPSNHYFNQHFYPGQVNPIPFYWKDFKVEMLCTYQIHLGQHKKSLWEGLKSSVRTDVRNATQNFHFHELNSLKDIYSNQISTFQAQKTKVPFTFKELKTLDQQLMERQMRKMYGAVTPAGDIAASVYTILEKNMMYTLMIGSDPKLRSGGAVQFLIWNLMERYTGTNITLDFCGSMIEQIEKVFRAFGSSQVPYVRVRKSEGTLVKISQLIAGKPK